MAKQRDSPRLVSESGSEDDVAVMADHLREAGDAAITFTPVKPTSKQERESALAAATQHKAQLMQTKAAFIESNSNILRLLTQSTESAQQAESAVKNLQAENDHLECLLARGGARISAQAPARGDRRSIESLELASTWQASAGQISLPGTPIAWMPSWENGNGSGEVSICQPPPPTKELWKTPDAPAPRFSLGLDDSNGSLLMDQRGSNISSNSKASVVLDQICSRSRCEVHTAWRKGALQRNKTYETLGLGTEMDLDMSSQMPRWMEMVEPGTQVDENPCIRCVILHPQSIKRICWDLLQLLLITYDLLFLPLQVFNPPRSSFTDCMTTIARLFWTCDLIMSCITGYIDSAGVIELRWFCLMKHYFRTWFILDFPLVVFEWMDLYVLGGDYGSSTVVGRAGRTIRLIRMVRLLRLVRIKHIISAFIMRVHSERLLLLLDIAKVMAAIISLAHLVACLWYWIGTQDEEVSWTRQDAWISRSLRYRYTSCLHWSLSQLTGGMDEIHPQNTLERVFTIFCFLVAFMTAAIFVSNITSSMTRLDMLSSRQSMQTCALRRYLVQHKITNRLIQRLQRNAVHTLKQEQKIMHESSVEMLSKISEPLLMELHFEMYSARVRVHAFFDEYIHQCPHVMRQICHRATHLQLISCGDLIFSTGEIPAQPKMYIVVNGELHYASIFGGAGVAEKEGCVAEAVLWTSWIHRGYCRAKTDTSLCTLDAMELAKSCQQFDHPHFDPSRYAAAFVADLNAFGEEVTDITNFSQLHDGKVASGDWMYTDSSGSTATGSGAVVSRTLRRGQDALLRGTQARPGLRRGKTQRLSKVMSPRPSQPLQFEPPTQPPSPAERWQKVRAAAAGRAADPVPLEGGWTQPPSPAERVAQAPQQNKRTEGSDGQDSLEEEEV